MDYRRELPEKQEGKILYNNEVSAFGLSLQGASHATKENTVPCQDYSDLRYLEKEELLIAAIADGVGSCSLSHWGAYTAVCAVLDSTQAALEKHSSGEKQILDSAMNQTMKGIMYDAFCAAQSAVEQLADQAMEAVYNFQSTLTLAIYDGENLFFGHVGDDGIVVQMADGNVEMLTTRLKGEEASSVYPLQSGEKMWKFGRNAKPVVGFLMATDGVLDAFVSTRPDYFGVNYNKGVCYSFMEDAIYILAENSRESAQKALDSYKDYMLSEKYRERVTDDLTLIAVVSNAGIQQAKRPRFSMKIWNAVQEASNEAKELRLRSKALPRVSFENTTPAPKPVPPAAPAAPAQPVVPVSDEPEKERKGIVFPLLLSVIGLLLGVLIGRIVVPPVSVEEYEAVRSERDHYVSEYEALEEKYAELTESNEDLESQLSESKEAKTEADQAYASLTEEKSALEQALQEIRQAATEPEETTEEAIPETVRD